MNYRIAILSLLLVFFAIPSHAQQHNYDYYKNLPVDSMELIVKNWKGEDTMLARLYIAISTKYLYKNNDKAKDFAQKAEKISAAKNYERGLARAYNNLGLLYAHEDNLQAALNYLNKGAAVFKKNNDLENLSGSYNNLGIVYGKAGEYEKAIENFEQSIKYRGSFGKKAANVYMNMGDCYKLSGNYTKAIEIFTTVLRIKEIDVEDSVLSLSKTGSSYLSQKLYDSALYYFKIAEKLQPRVEAAYFLQDFKSGFGQYYSDLKQYPKAIPYLKSAYDISAAEGNIESQADAAKQLAFAYEQTGNFSEANRYNKDVATLSDSLNKIANTASLKKVENDFELKRQDDKLKLLEQEQALNKERLWRSRALAIFAFVVIGALLLLGFSIYKRSRLKMRIADEKVKSAETQMRLQAIESYLNGQLLERKRLAQDLHDGLGATLAGIKLKALGIAINNGDKENMNELISEINLVCEDVRNISHNLIPPEFEKNSFAKLIELMIKNQRRCHPQIVFDFSVSDENQLEQLSLLQKTAAYRILQEAVNNAVKHAAPKNISILATPFEKYISFVVEDDGNGFDIQKSHDGIGLHNMRDRAKEIDTQLNIDATPGKGTVVAFDLALNN